MYKICVIKGDGIGPEIVDATLNVLEKVHDKLGLKFQFTFAEAGDSCLKKTGHALPEETISIVKGSDACLKGPIGETAMDTIVVLRQMLDLYVNLRPIKCYLHTNCMKGDIDFVIVRENTEDLYKGLEFQLGDVAIALRVISRNASRRIAEQAFRLAELRNRKRSVVCVHKANVMRKTCGLFVETCREVASRYKDIKFSEMYVDAAAMNLIRRPEDFDVILTTNMFGDILSDEAAQLVGGLGMAPSANIGDRFAIFEPVHGSAPDIAGKGIANPISMILSAKMMLEWLANTRNDPLCNKGAFLIENGVKRTLEKGIKTIDLGGSSRTQDFTSALINEITNIPI
ncbi:MAG: isocitrate/isopropylmalate dehydrogenase family protein [Nitrososphaerota archaeon]|nr:isocitrate/isopropylmalate dehydrogenase family protein [Nitrososphaerota archaeon]